MSRVLNKTNRLGTQLDRTNFSDHCVQHLHTLFFLVTDDALLATDLPNTYTAVTKNCTKKNAAAQHSVDCNRKLGPDTISPGVGGGESI